MTISVLVPVRSTLQLAVLALVVGACSAENKVSTARVDDLEMRAQAEPGAPQPVPVRADTAAVVPVSPAAAGAEAPDRVGPDRVGPDRIGPDRVGPDRVGPDRVGPELSPVAAAGEVTGEAPGGAEAPNSGGQKRPSLPVDEVASAQNESGRDFIDEARLIFWAVACAGDAPPSARLDARVVAYHCKLLNQQKEHYRHRYATRAKEFLARLRPADVPATVVYPFGGGDLISALVAYPDALEITTLSLEHAGDPRRVANLTQSELRDSLAVFRREIGGMLSVSNNTSKNLSAAHENLLPAQLSSFLIGLAVHDFVPVSVRYFTLTDAGQVRYLNDADIAAVANQAAKPLKFDWVQPNFSAAFSNVEIRFRRPSAGADAPIRVHRHFAVNLADAHLRRNPVILAYLQTKGRIAAMTKAASYLLWRRDFSRIRNYLLAHLDFMFSDSTGIPPLYARRAAMTQIPLGRFNGAFLTAPEDHNSDFLDLWSQRPYRRLRFRFGYVDTDGQPHLLLTMPRDKAVAWRAQARKRRVVPAAPGAQPAE